MPLPDAVLSGQANYTGELCAAEHLYSLMHRDALPDSPPRRVSLPSASLACWGKQTGLSRVF
ncbi:hypothetical protein E2C01_058161 [Portunus trituberculatus]|uniref:Uncharacterized protein n=1 Tax=Portunus trituberculatus TaxID=210409 RepID=A0A5B7GUV0_PORTR|nr:hypothetical protein [Portunus trituberculatus]